MSWYIFISIIVLKVFVAQLCPTLQPHGLQALQASLSSGLQFPSPGDLPNQG